MSAVSAGMAVLWFCLYLYYLAILGRRAVSRNRMIAVAVACAVNVAVAVGTI